MRGVVCLPKIRTFLTETMETMEKTVGTIESLLRTIGPSSRSKREMWSTFRVG